MTTQQLIAFHQRTFCNCGKKATRIVRGIGFCNRHYEKAVIAATSESLAIDSLRAADDFIFDKRRVVGRKYSNREGCI